MLKNLVVLKTKVYLYGGFKRFSLMKEFNAYVNPVENFSGQNLVVSDFMLERERERERERDYAHARVI